MLFATCGWVQGVSELLHWLEKDLEVSSNEFSKIKADPAKLEALQPRPTLAVAQANVAALEEVLHMDRPQVLFAFPV